MLTVSVDDHVHHHHMNAVGSSLCHQMAAPYSSYQYGKEEEGVDYGNYWVLQSPGSSRLHCADFCGSGSPPVSPAGTGMHLPKAPRLVRQESGEAGFQTMVDMGGLSRFLPRNNDEELDAADVYSSTEFRMYEFKVRRCMRGRSHDWTECPFAHPGEKARRRDPRRFNYSGTPCPDFRKGTCRRGDACEYAHGVFECWLHPMRYRTQPCKDGRSCKRRICFFAHTPEQVRLLSTAAKSAHLTGSSQLASPTSALSPPRSPDLSPQQPLSPQGPYSPSQWPVSHGLPSPGYRSGARSHPASPVHDHWSFGSGPQLERYHSLPTFTASQEPASAAASAVQGLHLAAVQEAAAQVSAGLVSPGRRGAGSAGIGGGSDASSRAAMIANLIANLQAMELQSASVDPDWLQAQLDAQAQAQAHMQSQLAVQQLLEHQRRQLQQQRSRAASQAQLRRLETAISLPADSKWLAEAEEEERLAAMVERVESGRDLRAEIYGKLRA